MSTKMYLVAIKKLIVRLKRDVTSRSKDFDII